MSRIAAAAALVLLAFSAPAAMAAEILIHDAKSQPESMAVAPDGTIYAGSASTAMVYRVKKGSTTPEVFVDASADGPGTFFFGQLVDAPNKTLWTCELTPTPGTTPVQRKTALRGFDLDTGKEKLRWALPGDNSTCNDFAFGPDKALYISDTGNAKIYRLAPGAKTAELWMSSPMLAGIDGLTFMDGVLYINSVTFNKLFRIPVEAGKPGRPVDIWMDAPVHGPDGMRAAGGKLYISANGSGMGPTAGEVLSVTVNGDRGHVTVLKDKLDTPTGIEPVGDTLWFTERGVGKVWSIPIK